MVDDSSKCRSPTLRLRKERPSRGQRKNQGGGRTSSSNHDCKYNNTHRCSSQRSVSEPNGFRIRCVDASLNRSIVCLTLCSITGGVRNRNRNRRWRRATVFALPIVNLFASHKGVLPVRNIR